nr:MAG TPA: hypothetical protein [Caudoviricetes sp.]
MLPCVLTFVKYTSFNTLSRFLIWLPNSCFCGVIFIHQKQLNYRTPNDTRPRFPHGPSGRYCRGSFLVSGKRGDRHCGRHRSCDAFEVGAGMNEWFENAIAAAGFLVLMYTLLSLPGY